MTIIKHSLMVIIPLLLIIEPYDMNRSWEWWYQRSWDTSCAAYLRFGRRLPSCKITTVAPETCWVSRGFPKQSVVIVQPGSFAGWSHMIRCLRKLRFPTPPIFGMRATAMSRYLNHCGPAVLLANWIGPAHTGVASRHWKFSSPMILERKSWENSFFIPSSHHGKWQGEWRPLRADTRFIGLPGRLMVIPVQIGQVPWDDRCGYHSSVSTIRILSSFHWKLEENLRAHLASICG